MCYCEIDDGPSVFWECTPTARKTHECCECGSPILPGEKYYILRGMWHGEFEQFKTCAFCESVRDWAYGKIDCVSIGDLWAAVGSEFEDRGDISDGQA